MFGTRSAAGDGRDETGAWTGTYKASALLWRQGSENPAAGGDNEGTGQAERITPTAEYIARITPPHRIAGVAVSRRVTTRDTPNAPPYPALLYRLELEVSRRDHVYALVVPAAALALLSFVPFYMRAEGGARLGLGRIVVLHCSSSTLYRNR